MAGDPGGAGRRYGRSRRRRKKRSVAPSSSLPRSAKCWAGRGSRRALPPGPSGAWKSSRPSARVRPRVCRPTPSTRTSGSNRSHFRNLPSRRCSAKAPKLAKEWSSSLALLAEAWLREAEFSYHYDFSTSLGPRMYYDPYGNSYYSNYDPFSPEMMARQRGLPMAVKVADLVKQRPDDAWTAFVDQGIKPKFATVFAKLYLKVNEEDEAFPYIEQLCATNPARPRSWPRNSCGSGPRTTTPTHSSSGAAGSSTFTGSTTGPRESRSPVPSKSVTWSSFPAGSRSYERCRSVKSMRSS